jgi:hypothetical protein
MKFIYTILVFILSLLNIQGQNFQESKMSITPDSVILNGIMTSPDTEFQYIALIIPGSGPTDLDGNGPMTKGSYLKKLSTKLADSNIASLRIDKRGIASSMDLSLREEDMSITIMVNDIVQWVALLNDKYPNKKITIIGHSEGSLVGMVAAQKTNIASFISIAGMGRPMDVIILEQLEKQAPKLAPIASKMFDSLKLDLPIKEVNPFLLSLFRPSVQPYIKSAIAHDPAADINKLNIPCLIIQGDNDIQVAVLDAELLHQNGKDSKLVIIKEMNHVLVKAPTEKYANIATYNQGDLEIDEELVTAIIKFIKSEKE